MAKIGLPKGSGKQLKVREKSVKSQGILEWILSGNPAQIVDSFTCASSNSAFLLLKRLPEVSVYPEMHHNMMTSF